MSAESKINDTFCIMPCLFGKFFWSLFMLAQMWMMQFQGSSNPLSSHYHGGVHDEKPVAHRTVNLLTSTIKADAEQSDLRFCFRIISPTKSYTLQVN